MNLNYANRVLNMHAINAMTPFIVFPFLPSGAQNGIIEHARILTSPVLVNNVSVSIGFYDTSNTYQLLFWASGSGQTVISTPFPLHSSVNMPLYYGIINNTSSTVYLIAHYFYINV